MFFGSTVALYLRAIASTKQNPQEIAIILSLIRPMVLVIVISLFLTIGFGIWLAHLNGIDLNATWLKIVYVLLSYVVVVGGAAGGYDRRTRELAEILSHEAYRIVPIDLVPKQDDRQRGMFELQERLRNPTNWAVNISMISSILVIIALMVFKPI
jgi:uncharacterized membrane protein